MTPLVLVAPRSPLFLLKRYPTVIKFRNFRSRKFFHLNSELENNNGKQQHMPHCLKNVGLGIHLNSNQKITIAYNCHYICKFSHVCIQNSRAIVVALFVYMIDTCQRFLSIRQFTRAINTVVYSDLPLISLFNKQFILYPLGCPLFTNIFFQKSADILFQQDKKISLPPGKV